jgi:hypothetical protein
LRVRLVDAGVDLTATFDEIEGCDGCVSWAACCRESKSVNECADAFRILEDALVSSLVYSTLFRATTDIELTNDSSSHTSQKVSIAVHVNLALGRQLAWSGGLC